jgi:hypothetical protein
LRAAIDPASVQPGHRLSTSHRRRVALCTRAFPLGQVGQTTSIAEPNPALVHQTYESEGRFGLLLRTSHDAAVSWTPLLKVEGSDDGHLHVRCLGRVGISRVKPQLKAGVRLDHALIVPYCDDPLTLEDAESLDAAIADTEALFVEYSQRRSRARELRGLTHLDLPHEREEQGMTLAARARSRAHGLEAETLLGAGDHAPGAAERLLTTFAALEDAATWKTRLAAMQCVDSAARNTLAQRALRSTIGRLNAEISLRSAFKGSYE